MVTQQKQGKSELETALQSTLGTNAINSVNESGHTALMLAAIAGDVEAITALALHGANLHQQDPSGNTAFMLAAYEGHQRALSCLLDLLIPASEFNVNGTNSCGSSALMLGVCKGSEEVVQFLLDKEADIHLRDHQGHNALTIASCVGSTPIFSLLLQRGGDVRTVDGEGNTTIMNAASYGHLDIVRTIHATGCIDVDTRSTAGGWNALMLACMNGREDVALFLADYTTNVDAQSDDGLTALMCAAHNGNERIVEHLVNVNKANINLRNTTGSTAGMIADAVGNKAVSSFLFRRGVMGKAMELARQNGDDEAIRLIEEQGMAFFSSSI
jgi:ankyrin repeat protein